MDLKKHYIDNILTKYWKLNSRTTCQVAKKLHGMYVCLIKFYLEVNNCIAILDTSEAFCTI